MRIKARNKFLFKENKGKQETSPLYFSVGKQKLKHLSSGVLRPLMSQYKNGITSIQGRASLSENLTMLHILLLIGF